MLAHAVRDFQDLEEANIQEVFECLAADLAEEYLECLTAHREPEDESSDTVHCCGQTAADYQCAEENLPGGR